MAAIKGNSILKIGVPVLLLVVGVLALRACQQTDSDASQQTNNGDDNGARNLTPAEKKAIGIGNDSPDDTVHTLVAKVRQMRSKLEKSEQHTDKLRDQNERLANKNQHVQSRIDHALAKQRRKQNKHDRSMMSGLRHKLSGLEAKLSINNDNKKKQQQPGQDMPVGLGVKNGEQPAGAKGKQLTWVDPLGGPSSGGQDQKPGQGSGNGGQANTRTAAAHGSGSAGSGSASAFKTAFDSGVQKTKAAAAKAKRNAHVDNAAGGDPDNPGKPVYTVPKNATLVGSVAMSALLGRVPRNGTVQDPYPFKVVIGPDNLTANGIELPGLNGAIVSGTAVGDWTLSCVRGTVKSITFVFADGRTEVVPKSDEPDEDSKHKNRDIGYISNPAGVPCVPGQRKTNARKFILTNLLLSAGQGAANAVSGGETTTSVNGLGSTQGVTGNVGKYIAGRAASNGMAEVRKWFNKRFSSTFDAVYVKPGHKVAVNIDKTLDINYDPNGRKVHSATLTHHNGLD
ncbi:TIGR03752 family integrating conjugative element protein [Salinisphaera orenii]|uniref:TIGR03752 family integrating conjugative element protein n=1 Tax=Salinisphaera orenii TaxID=856731 RepID=UPI000DBE0577